MLPLMVWFPDVSAALHVACEFSQVTYTSPSRMLLPEMTKLLTSWMELSVTTAPPKPPKVGDNAMKLSIFRVVTPFVAPTDTTLTDCGRLVSENGWVAATVPLTSAYQVAVSE